jgi:hypothetical protein
MKYNQPHGITNPDAPYIDGDPSQAIKGSIIPAAAVEDPQREIVGVIDKSGFERDDEDLLQLTRGVRQGINYVAASLLPGAPNDYFVVLDPPLDEYKTGLVLRIKIPGNNTGASTLTVDNLGSRSIHRANGAATTPNDLVTGMVVGLVYDGQAWQIINFMGIGGGGGDVNTYIVNIPYVIDTGTPNHLVAPFAPPITALTPGLLVLVKMGPGNKNTGACDIKVNSLAIVPVIRCDLRPLGPGDLIPGQITCLVFDGVSFQMISMVASSPKIMTGPMAFYVNDATGSDTLNDGLSAGSPFKTVPHAVSEMNQWTNKGFTFRIYVADGNYGPFGGGTINGVGLCEIIGNDGAPWNVYVSSNRPTGNDSTIVFAYGTYAIHGFRVSNFYGTGLTIASAGNVGFWNMDFAYCGGCHHQAYGNCTVSCGNFMTSSMIYVSGSAGEHHRFTNGAVWGTAAFYENVTSVILSIRTQISVNLWTDVGQGSSCREVYNAIDGWNNVVSGQKFAVYENGVLTTEGRGAAYLPGPTPGTQYSGGQYT